MELDLGTALTTGGAIAFTPSAITAATPIITKVIDTVSNGIGTLYSPINTYLNTKAEIAGLKKATQLASEINGDITIKHGQFELILSNTSLEGRALSTTINSAIQEQINMDEIVNQAIEIIQTKINNEDDKISEEPVSDDWAVRFFRIARDIRDEEMKRLWSSILADEIIQPGAYSLRTLELLRNLSKKEAMLFLKFVNLALCRGNHYMIPENKQLLEKFDISFLDIITLEELNLIKRDLSYTLSPQSEDFFMFGTEHALIVKNKTNEKQSFAIHKLTKVGGELYKLVDRQHATTYIYDVGCSIKHDNDKLDLYYTPAKLNTDNTITYNTNLISINL